MHRAPKTVWVSGQERRCFNLEIRSMIVFFRKKAGDAIHKKFMFSAFEMKLERNLDWVCRSMSLRWIVSICDTYADYGTPKQQALALTVVTMVNTERFSWGAILREKESRRNRKRIMFDGLNVPGFDSSQDTSSNWARRMGRICRGEPVLAALFIHAVGVFLKTEGTGIGEYNRVSRHVENGIARNFAKSYGVNTGRRRARRKRKTGA